MIGLVLVSHSRELAEGLRDLVAQMEPDLPIGTAGGTEDGELGTSLELVNAALDDADGGDGAIVLFDLGSAEMTAESALEFLDDDARARFVVVDAPLVEGALAAAGAAAGGGGLTAVADAALATGGTPTDGAGDEDAEPIDRPHSAELRLWNQHGLHARPAGKVARAVRGLDADVRVERADTGAEADAASLLGLVGLGAPAGATIVVSAGGPDGETALARVRDLVEDGFGEPPAEDVDADGTDGADAAAEAQRADDGGGPAPGADGLAIGPVQWLSLPEPAVPDDADDQDTERARLTEARQRARDELEHAGGSGGDILSAQAEVLDDPALDDAVADALADGRSAERAWWDAISAQRERLAQLPDAVFAARAADIDDVGRRVLRHLGVETGSVDVEAGAVILADDLTPSQVQRAHDADAAGAVVRFGTPTAHMAIMARSLGLPLVLRAGARLDDIAEGEVVVLDGAQGTVEVRPSDARQAEVRETIDERRAERERRRAAAQQPVHRDDGTRIEVAANVASAPEAELAVANGADGVGLLRTEFLFGDRDVLPGEDEQVAELRPVLAALDGRHTIIRTLDIGGDKPSAALDLDPVRNGFLGVRGVRMSLRRPELFGTQLRALLRLADEFDLSIMFPFVTAVDEITDARRHLERASDDLRDAGRPAGRPRSVGMMVEIPVAAFDVADFVEHVDFLSVGTNDLAQYLSAAGRDIDAVSDLTAHANAAIYRLVGELCDAATAAGRWVGVCGEMAADPDSARRFAELGVTELSMAPTAIPTVKQALREHYE